MSSHRFRVAAMSFTAILFSISTPAQNTTSTIAGVITDQSGAVVSNARIVATLLTTAQQRESTSNSRGELAECCRRPCKIVPGGKGTQHESEYATESAYTHQGNRSCAYTCGSRAIPVNQSTCFRSYTIAFRIGPRGMQRLKRRKPHLLKNAPKVFNPKICRRKTILGHGEVDRHETWAGPWQSVKQPTLKGKGLPEALWQCVIRHVLRSLLAASVFLAVMQIYARMTVQRRWRAWLPGSGRQPERGRCGGGFQACRPQALDPAFG